MPSPHHSLEPHGEAAAQRGELVRRRRAGGSRPWPAARRAASIRAAARPRAWRRARRRRGSPRRAARARPCRGPRRPSSACAARAGRRPSRCDTRARVGDVPRVQRVRRVRGAELDLLGAGDQPGQQFVVAGAVDHERARAAARSARASIRLAVIVLPDAAAAADQQRVVGVLGVVGVQALERAAGVGERERDPVGRAAAGADQRDACRRRCGWRTCARGGRRRARAAACSPTARAGGTRRGRPCSRRRTRSPRRSSRPPRRARRGRARARGAQRLVDRHLEQAGALVAGHLGQQLLVLVLLGVAVEVGHAAALLGAAVDRRTAAGSRA